MYTLLVPDDPSLEPDPAAVHGSRLAAIIAAKALSLDTRWPVCLQGAEGREVFTYRGGELDHYEYEVRRRRAR